jgi:hypothetical protein
MALNFTKVRCQHLDDKGPLRWILDDTTSIRGVDAPCLVADTWIGYVAT